MGRHIRHVVIGLSIITWAAISRHAHIVSWDLTPSWSTALLAPAACLAGALYCWIAAGPGFALAIAVTGFVYPTYCDVLKPSWAVQTAGLVPSVLVLMVASFVGDSGPGSDSTKSFFNMRWWSGSAYWHWPADWYKRRLSVGIEALVLIALWTMMLAYIPRGIAEIRECRTAANEQFSLMANSFPQRGLAIHDTVATSSTGRHGHLHEYRTLVVSTGRKRYDWIEEAPPLGLFKSKPAMQDWYLRHISLQSGDTLAWRPEREATRIIVLSAASGAWAGTLEPQEFIAAVSFSRTSYRGGPFAYTCPNLEITHIARVTGAVRVNAPPEKVLVPFRP